MALPITVKAGNMRVLLGNGATPEVFSAPCGLTTKGLQVNKGLTEVDIPDCDDPDAPNWIGRDVSNMSVTVSGDGVLALESEAAWNAAAFSTEPVNAMVEIEFTTGTRTFIGAFQLDSFGVTAASKERVKASFSMQSDGEITTSFA